MLLITLLSFYSFIHLFFCLDDLVNMGYVEQLISQIAVFLQKYEEGHPPSLEHLLNALLAIVEDNSMAQEISRTPELRFKSLLDFIIKNSENKEEFNVGIIKSFKKLVVVFFNFFEF